MLSCIVCVWDVIIGSGGNIVELCDGKTSWSCFMLCYGGCWRIIATTRLHIMNAFTRLMFLVHVKCRLVFGIENNDLISPQNRYFSCRWPSGRIVIPVEWGEHWAAPPMDSLCHLSFHDVIWTETPRRHQHLFAAFFIAQPDFTPKQSLI